MYFTWFMKETNDVYKWIFISAISMEHILEESSVWSAGVDISYILLGGSHTIPKENLQHCDSKTQHDHRQWLRPLQW